MSRCEHAIKVEYLGSMHTLKSLSEISGVARKTLYFRWTAAGRPSIIPGYMMSKSRKGKKEVQKITVIPTTKKYKEKPDRSPGWWERQHLASAGDNGFCKVERVNPSCCGMLADLPVAGDMP